MKGDKTLLYSRLCSVLLLPRWHCLGATPAVQCSCWIESVTSWWPRCLTGASLVTRRYSAAYCTYNHFPSMLCFQSSFPVLLLSTNNGKQKFFKSNLCVCVCVRLHVCTSTEGVSYSSRSRYCRPRGDHRSDLKHQGCLLPPSLLPRCGRQHRLQDPQHPLLPHQRREQW